MDSKYYIDPSSFCFTYEKEIANEHFQDLNMISQLLNNKEKKISSNTIEEIDQVLDNKEEDEDEPLWNQIRELQINGE